MKLSCLQENLSRGLGVVGRAITTRTTLPITNNVLLTTDQSRLKLAAEYAAENGFDAFTSSLLYSRYQNHELIRKTGEELGQHYGIDFLYDDYRVGWQEGIRVSKEMGLYRQQYCGCIYSEKDRYYPRSNN